PTVVEANEDALTQIGRVITAGQREVELKEAIKRRRSLFVAGIDCKLSTPCTAQCRCGQLRRSARDFTANLRRHWSRSPSGTHDLDRLGTAAHQADVVLRKHDAGSDLF